MKVGDLIKVKDGANHSSVCVVLSLEEKATFVYNLLSQKKEWLNNFIWLKHLEVLSESR